jgi:hypothetical protein
VMICCLAVSPNVPISAPRVCEAGEISVRAATVVAKSEKAVLDCTSGVAALENVPNMIAPIKAIPSAALNDNEGVDTSGDALDLIIADAPPVAKTALKFQGVDLDNAAQVTQIRTELKPNLETLSADIQKPIGVGFAEAARASTSTAAIFVIAGAISSLLLPKATKARTTEEGEEVVVMAH